MIRVEGIEKSFGSRAVLRDISFSVEPGEIFFLLGSSGSGKTTLLRILCGFEKPEKGELFLQDKLITKLAAHRRGVAMVFQRGALWPHLSVEKNVEYPLKVRRLPRDERQWRVEAVLEKVHLKERKKSLPQELSGGEEQRVAIARALVMEPKVLLLDEPLSHLDAKLRQEMRGEILKLQRELGITMIVVTHDQEEALRLADRLALLQDGRLEQIGTPEEMYRYPASLPVARFLGEMNTLEGKVIRCGDKNDYYIETPAGTVRADTGKMFQVGQAVACCFRPEDLWLGANPPLGSGTSFQGEVLQSYFLGEARHYELLLPYGGQLKASCPSAGARVEGKGKCFAHVNPEKVLLFPL